MPRYGFRLAGAFFVYSAPKESFLAGFIFANAGVIMVYGYAGRLRCTVGPHKLHKKDGSL
jgi:hypothetical protein